METRHLQKVTRLQEELRALLLKKDRSFVSLHNAKGFSNTTRSKSYKRSCSRLDCTALNQIIHIDTQKQVALVEPRVTMEDLVRATLEKGLIPPVVPEFKGITVGGAIMGEAAESSSHLWGTFHDSCCSFEILCGDGTLLKASPQENSDLFYGVAGSYGSLGALMSAEIQLIPAKKNVRLNYHVFTKPRDVIDALKEFVHLKNAPDFLDGILFSKDRAVIIEGHMENEAATSRFSTKPFHAEWYYQHVPNTSFEEQMALDDYLFRYDKGAFWMGAYLFQPPLLARLIGEGILKLRKTSQTWFTLDEIERFHAPSPPTLLKRLFSSPLMKSQRLWSVLHKAEKWVQDRFIIQDFCIPEKQAPLFCEKILHDPRVFPIWLCPIKGTSDPQIFSPHLLQENENHFINFGIYGLPSYSASMEEVTRNLEKKTSACGGRKVLYSRSYYTEEEFWQIYSKDAYKKLRDKTHAEGVWKEITEKVLSE